MTSMASMTTTSANGSIGSKSSSRPTTLSLDIPPPNQTQKSENSARPSSPRRIFSDPLPSASSSATTSTSTSRRFGEMARNPGEQEHPHSASATSPRNVRFGNFGRLSSFGRGEALGKSMTTPVPRKGSFPRGGESMKRRHSSETRMNVHTECGRHSDDWLFGGFSVSGAVKKLGKRKDLKGKEIIEELEENG